MKINLLCICFVVSICSVTYAQKIRSYFGSMAINSQTGISGTANNFSTKEEAIRSALLICNKKNKTKNSCKSVGYVSNGCAALAWSKSTRFWNGEIANDNKNVAAKLALEGCTKRGATDCRIVQTFCTDWETDSRTLTWW